MAADIDPLAVAAKACGIFVDPGDRAANLLGHREKAAAGILYPDKIRHDVMRAGAGEHLGRRGIGLGRPRPPGAAMDKDKDRRAAAIGIPIGAEEVELLDLGRAVRQSQRRPDALAGAFSVGNSGEPLCPASFAPPSPNWARSISPTAARPSSSGSARCCARHTAPASSLSSFPNWH